MQTFKWAGRAALVISAAMAAGSAYSQSTTQGAISGTVFDATGAAVPSAVVLIHNNGTGADLKITADSSGTFRAPQLAPGTYTVTFTAMNFAVEKENSVVVQVNEVTEVNPHLTAGETTQVVEVTEQVPVIQFESPVFGGHLSNAEIESIPINNRRWSSLALTTPGVVNDPNGFGLLSFRAISPLLNVVEIDGADDNQAFYAEERGRTRAGYSTSQAAVREFQVNTGVYSAEYGRAVGGVVNSVTKSGTNQLHGELYFFNRNSSRSAFQPGTTLTNPTTLVTSPYKPKDNRNQYGFQVGGPLIRDKLFWSYSFDRYARNFPGTAKANTPSTFFLQPTANAPANGGTCNVTTGAISTPTGGKAASATDVSACLLAARLNTVTPDSATYASAATAYSTQINALAGDTGSVPRFGDQNINTPKLDWQMSSRHHVSALYHRLRWDSPGGVQTQSSNTYAVDTFGTDFVKLDYGLIKLDSLVTSSITNEVRYQYGRELNDEGNQAPSAYTTNYLFNGHATAPEVAIGIGSGTAGNGFYAGQPYYGFRYALPDERKWQVGDTATYVRGKHAIRFGEDIVHNNDLENNLYEGNGFITYNNVANYIADVVSGSKSCGSNGSGTGDFPCWLSYAQGFGPAVFSLSTLDYGFFVQDDWKVMPNLTLNLGARYDYESLPAPYAGLSGTAAGTLAQTSNHPSDKNNISPRVGFSWDPFNHGRTAVHGGFGLYYGRIPNGVLLNALEDTGSALSQSTPTYSTTSVSAGLLPTLQTPATSPAPGVQSAYYLDAHFQNPYTEQFDLAIQQDLGLHNILSVSYLGSLGRELPNYINTNLDPTKQFSTTYTIGENASGNCGFLACGEKFTVNTYATRQQTNSGTSKGTYTNILPNTIFSNITDVISNINSNYHALSVDVTNRGFKWILFDGNYTWSRAMDFSQNQNTGVSTNGWIDPFNARANYGVSSLNVRHRAVGWAVLTAPGLAGHGPLTYLTNGWSLKPLIQVQSGLPFSAAPSGTIPQQCFVAGCLATTGSGLLGTSPATSYLTFVGRNTFVQPRTIVVDARVEKDFLFTEKYSLQLMGEAFNLANHANITGVATTSAYAITPNTTNLAAPTYSLVYNNNFGSTSIANGATANSNYAYSPRLIQLAVRLSF